MVMSDDGTWSAALRMTHLYAEDDGRRIPVLFFGTLACDPFQKDQPSVAANICRALTGSTEFGREGWNEAICLVTSALRANLTSLHDLRPMIFAPLGVSRQPMVDEAIKRICSHLSPLSGGSLPAPEQIETAGTGVSHTLFLLDRDFDASPEQISQTAMLMRRYPTVRIVLVALVRRRGSTVNEG